MKIRFIFLALTTLMTISISAQKPDSDPRLDIMLVHGEYEKVIDTCLQILKTDSFNPEIHYKMGLAYQNLLKDEQALLSFENAVSMNPNNRNYTFSLAKSYYNKSKNKIAEPLFRNLYSNDTMNWVFAFYLTSIYMQSGRYDESLDIYDRFLKNDSANYQLIDKKGYALLKKGIYDSATMMFEKSLMLKPDNTSAIKNLAFLYTEDRRNDDAVFILTEGIRIDPTDMDLYVRRAQIQYARGYTKRALDDYLVILASGDTSELHLRRVGIGYCNNLQQALALKYLLLAYKRDSLQSETCSYLGQTYYRLRDLKKSIYFYEKVLKFLSPYQQTTRLTYILLAESLKEDGQYKNALNYYLKAQQIRPDPNIYMIMANIYDEKLDEKKNALRYYQLYLDNLKTEGGMVSPGYLDSVKKRMEYLKEEMAK